MTPDKCEHSEVIQQSAWGGHPRCRECEMRFVPADVLEECRKALMFLRGQQGLTDMAAHVLSSTLARIDGVLGR